MSRFFFFIMEKVTEEKKYCIFGCLCRRREGEESLHCYLAVSTQITQWSVQYTHFERWTNIALHLNMQLYHLCSSRCIQTFPQGSIEDTLKIPPWWWAWGKCWGYDLFTLERAMQGHCWLFNVILVFLHPQTNLPAGLTEEKEFKSLVQGHPKEQASQATYSRALECFNGPTYLLLASGHLHQPLPPSTHSLPHASNTV